MFDLDEDRPDYFTDSGSDSDAPRPSHAGSTLDFDGGDGGGEPRRHSRGRRVLAWIITICVVALPGHWLLALFQSLCHRLAHHRLCGLCRASGILFKTFEADLISEQALTDTTRLYSRNITVSIPSPEIARKLQDLQGTGRRVTLTTERYYGMLPWRGASTTVVTALDSVD